MPPFNPTHLQTLLSLPYKTQLQVGRAPQDWAKRVDAKIDHGDLPPSRLTRSDLLQFCKGPNCDESCFLSVMAWGGMRINHGRLIWEKRESWLPTLRCLRTKKLSRKCAFGLFKKLQDSGELPGMGAPYFTKLIFFLRPTNDGYIMDRWTARSINLLVDSTNQIVRTDKNGYVTKENTADDYEHFCSCVDAVAARYAQEGVSRQDFPQGFKGEHAEELLFAKPRSEWREYLETQN